MIRSRFGHAPIAGVLGTYDQSLAWTSIAPSATWITRSTAPGPSDAPPLSVAVATGGSFAVGRLVDGPPTVVALSVTIVNGATTVGTLYDEIVSQVDAINALDLGAPLEVVGRPLDRSVVLTDSATTGGGTVDSAAGTRGALALTLRGVDGSSIGLASSAAFITLDNANAAGHVYSLWIDDAVHAAMLPGETIELPTGHVVYRCA